MSKYRGSIFRRSRRYGISLLENNKEFSKGKKRTTIPGQHGNNTRPRKLSNYGEQLCEKQKMSFMYGLGARQLKNFFLRAQKMEGPLSLNLFLVLESRLDNLVYQMRFAPTRRASRQLVNHGHILVNGRKADIPSMTLKLGDVIALKEKIHKLPIVLEAQNLTPAPFVEVDFSKLTGTFIRYPLRTELSPDINEVYVVEWFKRLI